MGEGKARGDLDRSASSDLWRRTLAQIPSLFGRLVYLTSLRDANTGVYEHQGLQLTFGAEEANRALRESHAQTFADWLNSPLQQQRADLDLYLSALTEDRRSVVQTWLKVAPYKNLAPEGARNSEYELFRRDFQDLLEKLRNDYSLSPPAEDE